MSLAGRAGSCRGTAQVARLNTKLISAMKNYRQNFQCHASLKELFVSQNSSNQNTVHDAGIVELGPVSSSGMGCSGVLWRDGAAELIGRGWWKKTDYFCVTESDLVCAAEKLLFFYHGDEAAAEEVICCLRGSKGLKLTWHKSLLYFMSQVSSQNFSNFTWKLP